MRLSSLMGTAAGALLLGVAMTSGGASAAGPYPLSLACENGRNYPIQSIALSEAGELVTGRLILGRGRGVHVRLIPMAQGYRYAGRGVSIDGFRGTAFLNFEAAPPIPCAVLASEIVVLRTLY